MKQQEAVFFIRLRAYRKIPVTFPVRQFFSSSSHRSFSSYMTIFQTMKAEIPILLLIFYFCFLFNSLEAAESAFTPSDSFLLNCGSSDDGVDIDNRKWIADSNKKIELSSQNSTPSKASFQDPSLPSQVPYMTAVILRSESTYSFPISGDRRHWVRLHFYPASYNDLSTDDSYFSVTSDGFTLLRNFSASLTAKSLTQAYIVKEFSVASSHGFINLTFTPDDKHKDSFAFINGIEVISMPDIYESPVMLIGFSDQTVEIGNSTLQTMYRVNVGGQYIPPTNDSGLTRTWYDDSPYLFGAAFGVTFSANSSVTIQYPADIPAYTAPVDVYGTARSMGPDPKINSNYNLTWIFQIDGNFMYLVRFHFCELLMTKINQRVFDIFINNQTAQSSADVIGWTGSSAVPTYKDYAVYVNSVPGDAELWIALHPSTTTQSEFLDAILNGLEIFKLNDTEGNLAGPNPSPSSMLAAVEFNKGTFSPPAQSNKAVISGSIFGATAFGIVFIFLIAMYQKKNRMPGGKSSGASGWLPIYGSSHTSTSKSTISGKSNASSHLSTMAASLCRHFSFAEIKQGTKNFDESLVIGVGGFGKVYKGDIDGGTKVAIKRANPSSEQGIHEFQTEIEMLSKLRHRHLVSLIGYCEENGEMCLVYDYMANGTMREHLYKGNKPPLSWKQRLELCIGAARGLHYLHTGAKYTIIHRDVKTTNILVDDKWVAKVSDFGLSKTGPNVNKNYVSTVVKGSFGYLDPEYFKRQQLTDKSDVYSFGVVLFESLCARPALNPSLPKEQVSLADWALHCQKKGILEDIMDPFLKGNIHPECLKKFAETAEKCLSEHGIDRPTMGDVLWNLEYALQLQEASDSGKSMTNIMSSSTSSANDSDSFDSNNLVIMEEENEDVEKSDDMNSSIVFSQLVHPKGR